MKKALLLSVLFAFAVTLAVGSPKTSAIEKAPVKSELVVLKSDVVYLPVVDLNVDAEFSPFVFEAATGSVIEHPYTLAQYNVLNNYMDVSRGPPEFR